MGISSSYKKKRPKKNSSQGRTKKKSKSRNRRYNKSKKIHLHDDSLAHSSDDDSRSFMSVSCSSSEDDHRSRRARSRTRKDPKGSKKKVRRRSLSHERSESHCLRKTIGTKRKGGSDLGTKPHKKKRKPSRDVSVSSTSSVSRRCDIRQVRSTSSHRREFEKRSHRGRYEGREREKRKLNKVRSGTKRNRYRSRSCSSCSRNSEDNEYWSDVKEAGKNNVKRLRSVITVIEEEGRLSDNDEHKEEIVYDNDDYPSCRSNDSNDGGHKRELDHQSNVACDNNMMVENEKGEEPVVLNIRTTELPENFKDVEGQCSRSNPSSCVVGTNDFVKVKVTEVSDSLNGEDLESTLRQRALENLRRFRGGFQPNANTPTGKKDNSYEDVKQSLAVKSEIVQINFPKGNDVKTVGAKSQKEDGSKSVGATQELKETGVPALRSDSNSYSQKNEITSSGSVDDHQSVTVKQETACVPDLVAVAGQLSEKVNSAVVSVSNIPKLATPVMRHNSFKNQNTLKQRSASDEPHQTNLLVTESSSVVCAAETAQTMSPTSNNNNNNNNNEDVKNACGPAAPECSSVKSTLALNGSNKSQDATTDSSQFEQKTMTVMRGGEMVQVSYKVYIPKKAPAFTRRQLKR